MTAPCGGGSQLLFNNSGFGKSLLQDAGSRITRLGIASTADMALTWPLACDPLTPYSKPYVKTI
jgi:hypothetical protein